ncbi:polymerase III polypeptide H [Epithele typhae]|uniref:polymerase III polypeptide H n=1 Tax=Epithele typhae TaxID=378194 RepID=UPI002007AB40|nr:polymerase III polypeptide H [Epithele typhae]KAH9939118.1 polymerase III polypeptide H [Epithele typhae]
MSNVNPTGRSSCTFRLLPEQAITNGINKAKARRALPDVGLCICVFDLAGVGQGKVRHGDGWMWFGEYDYQLCVFHPFGSEAILVKVDSSDEVGARPTSPRPFIVGFLDGIYVPLVYMLDPCAFDPKERTHFWLLGSETASSHELLDSALKGRMHIDAGDVLRLRVEAEEFHDDQPGPPKAHEGEVQQAREVRRSPCTITCPMSEQRLGPWRSSGVETTDDG